MKRYLKVFVALVVIVGALFWAVDSVRIRTYSGTDLNFGVGQGTVTATNPQDMPVAAQLVSPGTRTFTVSTTIAGAKGSSTTQGSGASAKQVFELMLPAGVSQITATRGTNVSFVTTATTRLDVRAQPLSNTDTRTTILIAGLVILGALYYISRSTSHRWLVSLRPRITPVPVVSPVAQGVSAGQSPEIRAYGDNRADKSKS